MPLSTRKIPVCQSLRDSIISGFTTGLWGTTNPPEMRSMLESPADFARCRGSECSNWVMNHRQPHLGYCRKYDLDSSNHRYWQDSREQGSSTVIPEREDTE